MKSRKMLCLILACLMMLTMSVTAFAAEEDISVIEVNPDTLVYFEEVIGSPDMQTGELVDDSAVAPCAVGDTLFSMTATRVTQLLTTYNSTGKYFTGGNLDWDEGVKISGTVTSSLGTGGSYKVKVGACYYDASTDTFVSVDGPYYFTSGEYDSVIISKFPGGYINLQNFYNQEKYYGHITNWMEGGYVYGSLTFSIAQNPDIS